MKSLICVLTILMSTSAAYAADLDQAMLDIQSLTHKEDVSEYKPMAQAVLKYSKAQKIDYRVVLALLMTESSMDQTVVSSTGDLGIGQINYKIWSKEFKRLKKVPLEKARLKTDVDYAIARTVEILAILKNTKDPLWIGKYHSNTPKLKQAYSQRIAKQLKKLNPDHYIVLATNP